MCVCVCVCVCERESEGERESNSEGFNSALRATTKQLAQWPTLCDGN